MSQWVVKQVCAVWDSFFAARAAYARDPSRFVGRPKLPHYKAKDGRNLLTYTIQAISRVALRRGVVIPSRLEVELPTKQARIAQVRVVPRGSHYAVEVVYAQDITPADVNPAWSAGVALGVSNLVAIATSKLTHDEAYTSKCSFFDGEPVGKRSTYAGKRLHRGLFRTASGRLVNADINAAYNQIANVAPDAFGPGRRGCVVQPGRIALPNHQAVR